MWRRDSRTPGRHRPGQARTTVPRRLWDVRARAEAERLERSLPGWIVLYGPGSRRFYALAAWPAPTPVMLEDHTPEGLEERMRQAETDALIGRRPTPTRGGAPYPHHPR